MKKIKAYAGTCVPDDTEVIIDDYPNQDDEGELAVNVSMGDEYVHFYRDTKADGSVEFIIITVDKKSRVLTRYEVKKSSSSTMSGSGMEALHNMFKSVKESCLSSWF